MPKQYIGISRDHSGSMRGLESSAMNDYNLTIESVKKAALAHGIDTIVSVVKCGIGPGRGKVETEAVNSSVAILKSLSNYPANGNTTPLFDSVDELISMLSKVPDASDPDVSFLIRVITDGQDNDSKVQRTALGKKIKELQATDRWSFVFQVPRGYRRDLERLGIPGGNIMEWDQTEAGITAATVATTQAFDQFYEARSRGVRSTKGFYADLSTVSTAEVKAALEDITKEVLLWPVMIQDEMVSDHCYRNLGQPMVKGCAFYELTKREKAVQNYKKICIQDINDGKVYGGAAARQMLGLPSYGSVSISPGDHSHYKIFIQSTSVNRKLKKGTTVLYWRKAV